MFDKLKQLQQLRELQKQAEGERFIAEREGVRVVMTGGFLVEAVRLNADLEAPKQEEVLRDLLNEAAEKARGALAQRFAGLVSL